MTNKRLLELRADLEVLESLMKDEGLLDDKKEDDYYIEPIDIDKACDIMARSQASIKPQKNNAIPVYQYRTIKLQSNQDDSIALNSWLFHNDSREGK
jgi:hypothetical protein